MVAAFAAWHRQHEIATNAVSRAGVLVAHVAVECFSVLTRLPPEHRAPPDVVVAYLDLHFGGALAALEPSAYGDVLRSSARRGIVGGAVYDALIAASARAAGATLETLDTRATSTYDAVGADYRLLA